MSMPPIILQLIFACAGHFFSSPYRPYRALLPTLPPFRAIPLIYYFARFLSPESPCNLSCGAGPTQLAMMLHPDVRLLAAANAVNIHVKCHYHACHHPSSSRHIAAASFKPPLLPAPWASSRIFRLRLDELLLSTSYSAAMSMQW